jgi:chromosomal replication initiation ATPase DnaA
MAVATLRRRVEEKGHYGTMFVHNDKLVEALLDSGNDLVDRAFRSRFLIVDDFGRGMKADFKLEMLCSLACRRFDEGKPTILTTNLAGGDFESMDERLHSRMHQGLFVTTRGLKDWRKV